MTDHALSASGQGRVDSPESRGGSQFRSRSLETMKLSAAIKRVRHSTSTTLMIHPTTRPPHTPTIASTFSLFPPLTKPRLRPIITTFLASIRPALTITRRTPMVINALMIIAPEAITIVQRETASAAALERVRVPVAQGEGDAAGVVALVRDDSEACARAVAGPFERGDGVALEGADGDCGSGAGGEGGQRGQCGECKLHGGG